MTPPVAFPSMTSNAPAVSTSDCSSIRSTLLALLSVEAVSVMSCCAVRKARLRSVHRSEEHTSELQSLMRISYAVFCLKKKKKEIKQYNNHTHQHTKNYR